MEYTWNIYICIYGIYVYIPHIYDVCVYGIIYMEYICIYGIYMEYTYIYIFHIYMGIYFSVIQRNRESIISDLMLILVDSNEVVKQTKHQSGTKQ